MRPALAHVFEHVISKPRLDSYKGYFRTKSVEEAIGLYMWNSELSACFSVLLSFFEIALRNNVHRTMSQFYTQGVSSSHHWYDRMTLKPGTVRNIENVRYVGPPNKQKLRKPAPSPDEIVSRVSFGFWPGVLGTLDPRFANQLFPGIFPHHPLNANPLDWKVDGTRKNALAFIYELNDFRNRIAHREPLWKFAAIKNTSVKPPIVILPASNNYADSIARLQRLLGLFDAAMGAINQDFHADLLQSSWRLRLDYLLTVRGFARYKSLKHSPATNTLTPTEFRRTFSLIVKGNQPVRIRRTNLRGVFIPE